ncbi:MAG TPA: hypothetical protein VMU10_09690, partial [Desulfomonilia bacterium]|nr:hypothetical protein [Desulfomonilia bacterium]
MRKYTFLLSIITGLILFACGGGGGGGGGGGTNDTTPQTVYSLDYTDRDATKVYTFEETTDVTGNPTPNTSTLTYSYNTAQTIDSKYEYKGTVAGPFLVESVYANGTLSAITYSSFGTPIIYDDTSSFINYDSQTTSTSGSLPPDWTIGTEYTYSILADLLNSDLSKGTIGVKIGTKDTESTLKALSMESITVPAGTYQAIKTYETQVYTITTSSGTTTIDSTITSWYGNKKAGLVKSITDNTITITSS